MTSADLDHNDELLAAKKKEKLEWVTPRLTRWEAEDTEGTGKPQFVYEAAVGMPPVSKGPS